MSARCRHENATGYMRRDSGIARGMDWCHAFTQPGQVGHHDRITCDSCGAWLSLGPANDEPAEVQVEIRAAARALNNPTPGADRFEFCPSSGSADLCDLCQEHLLAHDIATHDATHEHEGGEL